MTTERKRWTFVAEPAGECFRQLLMDASRLTRRFGLIQRPDVSLSTGAQQLLELLQPTLLAEQAVTEWPGTQLLALDEELRPATLRVYRWDAHAPERLLTVADRLYAFVQPSLCEDLSLWRNERECWLGSIAHERDGFIEVDQAEFEEMSAGVRALLRPG